MKTRARGRHNIKNQPQTAVQQTRAAGGVELSSACVGEHNNSAAKSSGNSPLTPSSSESQNFTSARSVLEYTSEAQSVASTRSHPAFGELVPGRQPPSQNNLELASPREQAACVHVQEAQCSASDRQTSPLQLTELVSSAVSTTCCPPSDKNHNLPPMYVTSSQSLHCPTPVRCNVEAGEKLTGCPNLSVDGNAGFAASYYYHDLNEGKKLDVPCSSHYSVSPASCIYPKDSLYPPQNTFDSQVCKIFSFCSLDTGSECSPPEMSTYASSSTSYTSLLTSSITSTGSPDSVQWSPDSSHVLPPNLCLPKPTASQPAHPLPEAMAETGKCPSETHSSVHTDYYSDDQSLGQDSIQDVKQDILMSDLHKHIYENFSQHLDISSPDEESHDHAENASPGRRMTQGKAGTSSKKRRRRTQTPVQRKAANMRERKRMCYLNKAFNCLKDRLPNVRNRKKLSRIQTLKAAIFYIGLLTECLQSS